MKKILRTLMVVLLLAVVVLFLNDEEYSLLHISNYTFSNMVANPIFSIFFILLGLIILSRSILFWRDEDYTRGVLKNSEILLSRMLGMDRAIKIYQRLAPFSIVIAVGVVIFGVVLYFI